MFNAITEIVLVIICTSFLIYNFIGYFKLEHKHRLFELTMLLTIAVPCVLIILYSVYYVIYYMFEIFNIKIVIGS